ncbi:MAG: M16 family metallopeptidase, partial [Candidatus Dormibacteraceae bacterium]
MLENGEDNSVVQRSVLPVGLRVITERLPGAHSVAVGIWVGAGSRDEESSTAGAAHYLEHLLFKGSTRRNAAQIAETIDAVGGELNAFTAAEHTCYYTHVLDTDLSLALDLLCDVVLFPSLAGRDVELERGVILDEIAMRNDDPEELLHEAFGIALLGEHPLSRSILGTHASIAGMDRSALRGFYQQHYLPDRMVLAIAGNVDHDQVLHLIHEVVTTRWTERLPPAAPRFGHVTQVAPNRLQLRTDDTEQAHVMLGVPTFNRYDERRFILSVLNTALGGGMSSRLFQEVRERRGLAYQVYSSMDCTSDTGSWALYAGTHPDRLGSVIDVMHSVLIDIGSHGLSEAEITKAKGQLRGELVLGLEDVISRMSRIGKGELNYADHLSVKQTLRRIDAVTVHDVADLAGELLRRPLSAAVVGPYAHCDDLP